MKLKLIVVLERRGTFYEAVSASLTKPSVAQGQVVLRGKAGQPTWFSATSVAVHVRYGLERYYVPEGTGNPQQGKLTVAAIRNLVVRLLSRHRDGP